MRLVLYSTVLLLITALYTIGSTGFETKQRNVTPPKLKYPKRYIRFQAGDYGHKPWDHFVSFTPKANFNAAVFTKLLNIDSNYKIHPGVIKEWYWNPIDLSYDLTINTNLEFDTNRKVSPIDIEFAILKHFISSVEETDKRLFYDIKGIEKLKIGTNFKSGMCQGVKIVSADKIKIFLNSTNPNFLYTLGDIVSPIAPVEDFKKDYFTFKKTPRGTGPYKVIWSDNKSSLVRLRRKNAKRYIKNDSSPLEIDFINHGVAKKNHLDIVTGSIAKDFIKDKNYTTLPGPIPIGVSVIDFNHSTPLGSDINFRKAVSLAIDRKNIETENKFRVPYHEMIPSKYYGRSGLKYEYNPKKSRKIVQKLFSKISSHTKPILGIYHGGAKGPKKQSIVNLENQLRSVGLHVLFMPDDGVYFAGKYSKAVLATYGAVSSFIDPLASLSTYLPGTTSEPNTDLKDKVAIDLFKKIKAAGNKKARHHLLVSLSKHFHDQTRQVPINEIYQIYSYGNKVKTLNLKYSLMVVDFTKVELKKL